MRSAEIIRKALSNKVEDYEIYVSRGRMTNIEVKDGEIDSLDISRTEGLGLRVLKNNRMGFSFTSIFSEEALRKTAENAIEGAVHTVRDELLGFPAGVPSCSGELHIYDPYVASIPQRDKIDMTLSLEGAARSYDPRIKKTRKAYYREVIKEIELLGKERETSCLSTRVSAGILAVAEDGKDSQIGWDSDYKRSFKDLNPVDIGRRAAEKAVRLLGAREGKTAKMSVILENALSAEFLEVLSSSFLADNLQKGKSLLKGKVNKKIFSSLISIVDDGVLPGGWATLPFDDEGNQRKKTTLVKEGTLMGYLYDYYWAKKEGKESTGNSYRQSFKAPPGISYTNLYINRGSTSLSSLMKKMEKGFYITDLLGVHTANPVTGDFSLGAMGFLVEKGEITYPIKGVAISGNLLDLFNNVIDVGEDLRFFGGIGSPSLLLEKIDISGK